jgi:Sec-independent protein translocase protein TatA
MPYELSLPGGGVAEFPDDLPIEKARQAVVDHIAKTYPQEEQVGAISQFLKMAGLGAAPAAAGLAAFGPSAALGAPLAPATFGIAPLVTGILGSTAAALGVGKGQAELLERAPELAETLGVDPETLARGARQSPTATTLGSLLPAALTFRPASPFAAPLAATAGAGIAGGVDLGVQAGMGEAPIDWQRVGLNALAGAVLRDPNALGRSLLIGKTARDMFGVTPRPVSEAVPPAPEVVPPVPEVAPPAAEISPIAPEAAPPVSRAQEIGTRRGRVMREGEVEAATRERDNYANLFSAIKGSGGRFTRLNAVQITGDNPSAVATLNRLKKDGLIESDGVNWVLTNKGAAAEPGPYFQMQQRLQAGAPAESAVSPLPAEPVVPEAPTATPLQKAKSLFEKYESDPVYAKAKETPKELRKAIEELDGELPPKLRTSSRVMVADYLGQRVKAREAEAAPAAEVIPEAPPAAPAAVIPEAEVVPTAEAIPEAPPAAKPAAETAPATEPRPEPPLSALLEARDVITRADAGALFVSDQLRKLATRLGLQVGKKAKKEELLAAIRAAVEEVPPPVAKKPVEGEIPLNARAEGTPPQGMTGEAVSGLITKETAKWKNAPEIIVAANREELLQRHGVDLPAKVQGVYQGGRVYMVANELATPSDATATLFHEALGHYGFRNRFYTKLTATLDGMYNTNPKVKRAANQWIAKEMQSPDGRKYLLDIARNYGKKSVYRIGTEEALVRAFSEKGYMKPPPGFSGLVSRIRSLMRSVGRSMGWVKEYTNEDVVRIMRKSQEYATKLSKREPSIGVRTYAATPALSRRLQAEEAPRTLEEIEQDLASSVMRDVTAQRDKTFTNYATGVWKSLTGKGGVEKFVKNFQNLNVKAKKLQENLRRAGVASYLYDYIVAAPQKAAMKLMSTRPVLDEIDSAAAKYIAKYGIDKDTWLARMHMFSIGASERDVRRTLFLTKVPLSEAADIRRTQIVNRVIGGDPDAPNGVSLAEASKLRDELEALVDADIAKPIAARLVDGQPAGKPSEAMLDMDSALYNVAGPYTKDQLADLRAFYAKEYAENEEIRQIFDPENGLLKQIKDATIQFNKAGNYHSTQLDSLIAFYRNPNYMPFKGKGVKYGDDVDKLNYYGGARLSGDLLAAEERRTGRSTDADNPYLRLISDHNRAAGKQGITEIAAETARLGQMGTTATRVVEPISFAERFRTGLEAYKDKDRFFLYKPDGSVEVWKIDSEDMREAIKGFVDEPQAWATWLGSLTSNIASMHTRWNPSFPVYNYIRDAITNGPLVGTKYGPKVAAQYAATVASKVADGGMLKGFKVARLLSSGNLDEIKRLAKTDEFYASLDDYVSNGGLVTYRDALNMRTLQEGLADAVDAQVGKKKFATTWKSVTDALDIWNDGFELTSRAAGYSVIKPQIVARMKAELGRDLTPQEMADANLEATQFVRGLFNYSETGKYGREMGALFMFSRSAITGATRFWDSFAPAFQNVDERLASVPREVFTGGAKDEAEVAQRIATYRKNFEQEQKNARLIAMGMMGMGVALYNMALMMSENDSMGRNKVLMDNMDIWQRNARIPVNIEGMDYLNVPWGFGFGMFGATGAQLASVASGGQSILEAASNLVPIAMDSAVPIPSPQYSPFDHPTAFFVNSVMPSVVRPLMEYALNVDAFGKEIYVNRMNQYSDPYTGGERLPEIYTTATSWLAELPGATGEVIMSPKTLHFFVNSYLDGVGRIASSAAGLGSVAAGSSELDLKQMVPIVSSFIGVNTSYDAREYQDTRRLIGEYKQRLDAFENRPEQMRAYLERNPNAQLIVDYYNKQSNRRLRDVQAAMNRVRESDMPQYMKRDQLEALGELRDIEMKNITDTVNSWRN